MRLSMDCKATVNIGDYSRGGKTRGDNRAADHDMGCEKKHTPFGVVNEDSGSGCNRKCDWRRCEVMGGGIRP
jgi:hypothetical protein